MLLSLAPKLFCPPALGPRKAGVVLLWGGLQGGRGREAGLGGGGRRAPSEGLGLQDVAEEIRLWNVRCRDRWSRWRLGQELCIAGVGLRSLSSSPSDASVGSSAMILQAAAA